MKNIMNKIALASAGVLAMGLPVLADDPASFDAASVISDVTTSVSGVVTGIGGLLAVAIGLYAAFVAYRKLREGLNKA